MALVDYVSSDEDDPGDKRKETNQVEERPTKRKRGDWSELPPLPSKFHDLYASTTRISTRDDPSLHGGRTRGIPHVEGNWPTHLYIEWYPIRAEHDLLNSLIQSIKSVIEVEGDVGYNIQTFLTSDLGAPQPLHISLSRPIGFLTDQKDPFLTSLMRDIKASGIRPFDINPCGLDWVPNSEKTRWFLVLRLSKSHNNALNTLLNVCNKVVENYGELPLYSDAADTVISRGSASRKHADSKSVVKSGECDVSGFFHISVGWTLTQPNSRIIIAAQEIFKRQSFQEIQKISILVTEVKAKIGNIVTSIEFPLKAAADNGILGN